MIKKKVDIMKSTVYIIKLTLKSLMSGSGGIIKINVEPTLPIVIKLMSGKKSNTKKEK